MPGGIIQLAATATSDQYVMGTPQMSYFRQVYKRHTPFAMESVQQTFLTKPVIQGTTRSTFTCRIQRVADLLQEIYLAFTLPDIYSDETFRFRWIPHLANYMIYTAQVAMDTQVIDTLYGEWMDVWNELTLPPGKQGAFSRMTGDLPRMTSPVGQDPTVIVQDNRMYYSYYPQSSPGNPSIRGGQFFVPLSFWFTRNPALALPLIALQYQNVDVTIELRSAEELYQLYDLATDQYWSPSGIQTLYAQRNLPIPDVGIGSFLQHGGGGPSFIDINGSLECNFVYLDTAERYMMAATPMDFLVENVYRTAVEGIQQIAMIDLVLNNPIKEMVFITRRGDYTFTNELANYTYGRPEDDGQPILSTAKILWNGIERIAEKPATYFNLMQPFQYHSNSARQGVYVYSYALLPEKIQPSGSFNASGVSRIQLYATFVPPPPDLGTQGVEVVVYHRYYNIFRVISGQGGMVYTS